MGDRRFAAQLERVRLADDPAAAIHALDDDAVVQALAAATIAELRLADVLATEAMNRLRRNRTVLANIAEGVVALGPDGRIRSLNMAAERLLGWAAADIVGMELDATLHGHPEGVACPVLAALAGRRPVAIERETFVRRDGTLFPAACSVVPMLADGVAEGAVLTFRDISDRLRAEAAADEKRQLSTSILESITDAFFAVDRAWRFTYVNREAEALLGHRREELLGRAVWDVFPQAVDTVFYHEYHRALAEHAPVRFDAWYAPLARWFDVRAFPRPGGTGLSVYFTDITERKEAQAALDYQVALFRALNEASPDGIVVVGPDRRILTWNRAFEDTFRFPPDVLALGDDDAALDWARGQVQDPEGFIARVRALYANQPDLARDTLRFVDGRVVERWGAPVRARHGRVDGWVWGFHDVTERERQRAAIEEQRRRYRVLHEESPAIHLTVDEDGRVTSVNAEGASVLGFRPEEMVGRDAVDMFHPDDRSAVRVHFARILASAPGTRASFAARKMCRDGSAMDVVEAVRRLREGLAVVCVEAP